MTNELVRVNKYSEKIRELTVLKRISVDYPLLTRNEIAEKLAKVADSLPPGLTLQIDSAYRTKRTQQILWDYRYKQMGDNAKALVFNPGEGISPHCTGGAVDVSLVDSKGKEINLSEPFTKFYMEPYLLSDKISERAQELRILLNQLMTKEGLTSNLKEYWHFSYGDNDWARSNKCKPLYEEYSLVPSAYFNPIKSYYYKVLRRVWKLVNKLFRIETSY